MATATAAAAQPADLEEDEFPQNKTDATVALLGDDFEVEIEDETPVVVPAEGEVIPAVGDDEGEGGGVTVDDDTAPDDVVAADDDDLGEPEDDEFKGFSTPIKKRIMRERRLARRERAEKQALINERQQAIPQIQKLVAERHQFEDENFQLRDAYMILLETSLEQQILSAQGALKAAKDDGSAENEVQALSQLQDLVNKRSQAQTLKSQLATAKAARPARQEAQPQAQAQQQVQQPQVHPLTAKWLKTNRAWFGTERFAAETAAAAAIDKQLAQEGYMPSTAEYYREWDARINRKFPALRKKPGAPASGKGSSRTIVAAASSTAAPASTVNKGKVTLTRGDLDMMKHMGLDISDAAHLREYARNKMRNAS